MPLMQLLFLRLSRIEIATEKESPLSSPLKSNPSHKNLKNTNPTPPNSKPDKNTATTSAVDQTRDASKTVTKTLTKPEIDTLSNAITNASDEELLITMKNGPPESLTPAFKCLFDRHSDRVYKFALKKLQKKELAEEVVQVVFWKIFSKRELYLPEHSALAWIYIISKSETKDHRNREAKHQKNLDLADFAYFLSQEDQLHPNLEGKDWVDSVMNSLPDKEKEILQRRLLQDQDYSEIANALGLSEANIRQIVSRTLKSLKNSFKTKKEI